MRVDNESAYVLHRREYRDTSLLVELYTRHYGRICGVAKGARRQRSALGQALNLFQPLVAGWTGRGDLVTITHAEMNGEACLLQGDRIYYGLYINELLMKFLVRHDPHEALYDAYEATLSRLAAGEDDWALRRFEKHLLSAIGYGVVLDHDVVHHMPLKSDRTYIYMADLGPVPFDGERTPEEPAGMKISGAALCALKDEIRVDQNVRREVKRLMRFLINRHLEGRVLQTRRLWRSVSRDPGLVHTSTENKND